MRILQLHTHYRQPGGEDVVVRAEAELLREAGHQVLPWYAQNSPRALGAATDLTRSVWNRRTAREAAERVRRDRPDVAHVHNTWFAMSASVIPALRRAGVPVVMTLHNYRLMCANGLLLRDDRLCTDCVGGSALPGVVHRCYRDSVTASAAAATAITAHRRRGTWQRDVDLYLVPTAYARGHFLAAGLPPDRLRVKHHFVADPGVRAAPPSASRTVVFAGRLGAGKGIEVLLRAWSRAATEDLELVVAGDGPLLAAAQQLAGPGVRLAGRMAPDELRDLMLRARALVFPSTYPEPFGLVVLEAMAAGLGVVGSAVGAAAELVGDGAGWVVPAGDVAALAGGLERLRDDATVDSAGERARQRYLDGFTPAAALRQLERAYASVVNRPQEQLPAAGPYTAFPPRWEHLRIPRGTRAEARAGLALYAPCRRGAVLVQHVADRLVAVAGPRILPGRIVGWDPPMGSALWSALVQRWTAELGPFDGLAIYEQPQPERTGAALLLLAAGVPHAFVKVRGGGDALLHHEAAVLGRVAGTMPADVWVASPRATGDVEDWSYLALEPLPSQSHGPASVSDLGRVLPAIRRGLENAIGDRRPDGWEPMHGDCTPWNLRRCADGRLALFDWENAGWGPPGADEVLFRATAAAVGRSPVMPSPHREAVAYWLDRFAGQPTRQQEARTRRRLTEALRGMGGEQA